MLKDFTRALVITLGVLTACALVYVAANVALGFAIFSILDSIEHIQ